MFKQLLSIGFCLTVPLCCVAQESPATPPQSSEALMLQFENEKVSVWKRTITIDQPLHMQKFDLPRVVVVLKGGMLHRIEQDGTVTDLQLEKDHAYFFEADQAGALHAEVNPSHEPIELMVIELKKPQAAPVAPPPAQPQKPAAVSPPTRK